MSVTGKEHKKNRKLPYELSKARNGDLKVQIRDREYSPEEISAIIEYIKTLK